ncbi:ABC transporter ATP-binding protein [Longimicrobium terrae]|uniref:ABC-2 type transport system ATP-binding protein n=1 Tax=Longimicrobium terrae TaxID=1639882 RepID=A0A841H3B9_9BACT|nr:ABC transporter ATP-binding protein [Longimicrobium terrae]MBB4638101.1 ABC-2 type transport system ATP-binding protein [Longimicrobium terrae]MBB6072473.1 ABC-2 type transport system ATP-binding protein [Longimicrobium terrae]NNC32116.1 ABC transporter ATP-binding protein [Longimicrobium terrae]
MYAMETCGLTHRFGGGDPVLRNVELRVPEGSIYGFLGPNGAGKTTTLRLVLGLLGQQEGTIHLFGRPLTGNRGELLRQVGSSIESPSLYAHLTARENLRIWQLVFRCPERRIGEVLSLVGLSGTGSKRAGQFSLGMKQRLSLAVALLHEPRMLVLDEPTNGLDPHGILEMRDLLLSLNRAHGTTIVVSSHLLAEVERLVTDVAIISRGTLRFQGPLAELMARREATSFITFDSGDNTRALEIIAAGGWTAVPHEGKVRVPALPPEEIGRINHRLALAGVSVHEITAGGTRLETLFMDLVQD